MKKHLQMNYQKDLGIEDINNPKTEPIKLSCVGTLSINNYVSSNGFGFFSSPTLSVFNIPSTISPIDGTNFITYSWTTIYKAKNSGTILFKPISLRGQIIYEPEKDNYSLTPDLFSVSEPLKITINEPPLEGRPESFTGAISDNLKLESELDTQICKEGDPITLTLKISNIENPLSVIPPKLAELDGFKNNFRAFGEVKATPNEADKNATFEYSIRPISSGTIEFPAIELGYYNLSTNQYATTSTAPIPLRVDPAPQIAAFDGTQGGGFSGFDGFSGFGFDDIDLGSIFEQFMGGGFSSRRGSSSNRPMQGDDHLVHIDLTFDEAVYGCSKDFKINLKEKCSSCDGVGGYNPESCKTCGGRGRVVTQQRTILGVMQSESTCHDCNGTGKKFKEICSKCNGQKLIKNTKNLNEFMK